MAIACHLQSACNQGHTAVTSPSLVLQRINTTAVVGVALALSQAMAIALLVSLAATAIDRQVRTWIILGGFVLFNTIALAGVLIAQRQRKGRIERLTRAHELLNRIALLLETPRRAAGAAADLDAFVARLTELVNEVERVVEERRQRERELMRADQLAMVGQMAAGVAHELRNPLTSIKMLVQTGKKQDSAGLAEEDLEIIEHEIRRLERSLQRFLDFARPPHPERRRLDLANIVERTVALIEGRARKQGVQVKFDRPSKPLVVDVDADQIQQLLLNLMLNSLDVMPDGGALSVELASLPGDQVDLRVHDTGPGIPADLLPRLFDPFMSTKETGIGLGLAVSHRIAERHGGTLSADNQPGSGACFVLRLARAKDATPLPETLLESPPCHPC